MGICSAIIDSGGGHVRQLIVRNIEDEVVLALKRRAARHGRSAEAEHREILREALVGDAERPSFKDFLASMPDVGEDGDFAVPRDLPRDLRL
jgi:antitoxin FitA